MSNDNPMIAETLLTGVIALILWSFIQLRATRSPLGWISPTSLFALGLLILYIIPTLYWQFRPWNEDFPPYYDGLPLVMTGAVILGIPLFFDSLRGRPKRRNLQDIFQRRPRMFGSWLWFAVIPIVSGVTYRLYLFTLGYQGRNVRETVTVAGSEELALIVSNITFLFPLGYYLLVAFGNRLQRRFGYLAWIIEGVLQVATLHRWAILIFILRSAVFATLLGVRFKRRHWIAIGFSGAFTVAVIGQAGLLSVSETEAEGVAYAGPQQIVSIITTAFTLYESKPASFLDQTMSRLYLARSASALMENTPGVIQYAYGKTFLHVLYAWIPRYFWPEKPNMGDVHVLTTVVMPGDLGINPTGTIAELYVNLNFIGVFLGGILCLLICRWQERVVLRGGSTSLIWLCVYPVMAIWFIWADANLSQRLAEGLRMLLVFGIVWIFLQIFRSGWNVTTSLPIHK